MPQNLRKKRSGPGKVISLVGDTGLHDAAQYTKQSPAIPSTDEHTAMHPALRTLLQSLNEVNVAQEAGMHYGQHVFAELQHAHHHFLFLMQWEHMRSCIDSTVAAAA